MKRFRMILCILALLLGMPVWSAAAEAETERDVTGMMEDSLLEELELEEMQDSVDGLLYDLSAGFRPSSEKFSGLKRADFRDAAGTGNFYENGAPFLHRCFLARRRKD